MSIPRLVRHKGLDREPTRFDSCPRDDCQGKVEKHESVVSKLNLDSPVWECRSCDAKWKPAADKSPTGPRGVRKKYYLIYVEDSCNEQVEVRDEEYHANIQHRTNG